MHGGMDTIHWKMHLLKEGSEVHLMAFTSGRTDWCSEASASAYLRGLEDATHRDGFRFSAEENKAAHRQRGFPTITAVLGMVAVNSADFGGADAKCRTCACTRNIRLLHIMA